MKLNEMRIAITGQTGLVGSTVSSILEEQGHEIVPLFIDFEKVYRLGNKISPEELQDFECIVHSAYDFSARGTEIFLINGLGASSLLAAAARRDVKIILISSLAAHANTLSKYGQSKLFLEEYATELGGLAIRLGALNFGRERNIYFKLRRTVIYSPIKIGFGRKSTYVYPTDIAHLQKFFEKLFSGNSFIPGIYRCSADTPVYLNSFIFPKGIVVRLPLGILYLLIRISESVFRKNFNSDQIKSLMIQISKSEFNDLKFFS